MSETEKKLLRDFSNLMQELWDMLKQERPFMSFQQRFKVFTESVMKNYTGYSVAVNPSTELVRIELV